MRRCLTAHCLDSDAILDRGSASPNITILSLRLLTSLALFSATELLHLVQEAALPLVHFIKYPAPMQLRGAERTVQHGRDDLEHQLPLVP